MSVTIYRDANFKGDYSYWNDISNAYNRDGNDLPGRAAAMGSWQDQISSVDVRDGAVFVMYEHESYGGDKKEITEPIENLHWHGWGDKASSFKTLVDCNHSAQMWNRHCVNEDSRMTWNNTHICGSGSACFNNRRDFCDRSIANAKSDRCENWCEKDKNRGACKLREKLKRCKDAGLDENRCDGLDDMINDCYVYGINDRITGQQDSLSEYPCTVAGVNKFERDCKSLDIPLSICNTARIRNEKQTRSMRDDAQKTRDAMIQNSREAIDAITNSTQELVDTINESGEKQIKEFRQYYATEREYKKQMLNDMKSGLLRALNNTQEEDTGGDTTMMMVVVVIVGLACLTSSVALLFTFLF